MCVKIGLYINPNINYIYNLICLGHKKMDIDSNTMAMDADESLDINVKVYFNQFVCLLIIIDILSQLIHYIVC